MQMLKTYHDLLKAWKVSEHKVFQQLLKKRAIRSQSGIVSVQVLTKPFWCPGECIFCPNDFTMPKSYINTEPGAMRALLNNFDPVKQVYNRLLSLHLTGHDTDKIEMIVLGGTRDVYPVEYKRQFVKGLYDACNTFPEFLKTVTLTTNANKSLFAIDETSQEKTADSVQSLIAGADTSNAQVTDDLATSILINETAQHRIIGLTVETRPEYVTDENCQLWRELGVTRLEMGIQTTNERVGDMNKRGHTVQQCKDACYKLRQYGFKFSVHVMPGLYGSNEDIDIQTFVDIYGDPAFRPDEMKLYPTSVIPNTELYELYQQGKYTPITTESIQRIVTKVFRDLVPPYTRIKRLIRDIPSTEIVAGSSTTNLAQLMHEWLYKEWKDTDTIRGIYQRLYEQAQFHDSIEDCIVSLQQQWPAQDVVTHIIWGEIDTVSDRAFVSLDTRSREIRHRRSQDLQDQRLIIREYASTVGREFFIAMETSQGYLYGFTRLLLPQAEHALDYPGLWVGTALIRELHVYGQLATLKKSVSQETTQHTGVGRTVMSVAELIAQECGYERISVISGVWVKEYYRTVLGYHDEGTYVVKHLSS